MPRTRKTKKQREQLQALDDVHFVSWNTVVLLACGNSLAEILKDDFGITDQAQVEEYVKKMIHRAVVLIGEQNWNGQQIKAE